MECIQDYDFFPTKLINRRIISRLKVIYHKYEALELEIKLYSLKREKLDMRN